MKPRLLALALATLAPLAACRSERDLVAAALADDSRGQRQRAVWTLGMQGAAAAWAVPQLVELLANDGDPNLRVSTTWALAEIGAGPAGATAALRDALQSDHPPLRAGAAWALGRLAGVATAELEELLRPLADDPDPVTRQVVAAALRSRR